MLKSSKLYYSLFILNYIFLFFNSATWVSDYEDGLTADEKFGFSTMNLVEKIAFVIFKIVAFPFNYLPKYFNFSFIYWVYFILNAIFLAAILKFIFKNYKEKLFLIANAINLLFLLISLSIIFYYAFLINWIN